jgi:ATP-dependent Lon protease
MKYNLRNKRKHIEVDYLNFDSSGGEENNSDSDFEFDSDGEEIYSSSEEISTPTNKNDLKNELNQIINNENEENLINIHIDENTNKEDIFKVISSAILDEAQKIIDETEEEDMDEFDKNFLKFLNNEDGEDESNTLFDYFKKLSLNKKKDYIDILNDISKIDNKEVPIKFQILNSQMDLQTKNIALTNYKKLCMIDTSSGEYSKLTNWMNGILKIPFNKYLNLNVKKENSSDFLTTAYKTLKTAIYGHEEAKTHILQIFSKWIKNPNAGGNILALQGPMGNGKTTLVKKGISKSIDRPFFFIALGGASDVSYFNGHGYTYEGSMWGRIVDILMKCGCMNPIIYFDELDKISNTSKGDEIVHFLTHITDSSQNSVYQDNYFPGIKIDLSKILFIFSFNDEYKVDPILKDRMQVIKTKGFKIEDKLVIAKLYLLPELFKNYNYTNSELEFTDDIIKDIIKDYTNKEEGVRNLKRCLDNIISKVNLYSMIHDTKKETDKLNLSYTIKDFKIPYKLKKEDLKELLLKNKEDILDPPNNMYL